MSFKTKELEVPEGNPFEECKLGREESGKILTDFLRSIDEPFVLSIDAGWGRGKTTFIRMWKQYLENDGFKCLYFNAWENDFSDDPLISFIGEIESEIDPDVLGNEAAKKAKKLWSKTKNIGVSVGKRIIPVAAKLATAGVLDFDSALENEIGNLTEKLIEDGINNYKAEKDNLVKFRNNLEEFVNYFVDKNKPVIFFIDELDRCKPTYAVALLERLKHLFNVKGIVFVLATDREQLCHSVCALYGIGFDANGYLKRFIDIDYNLPSPDTFSFGNYLCGSLGIDIILEDHSPNDRGDFIRTIAQLSKAFEIGLRDQEQIYLRLNVVLRTTGLGENLYPPLMATMLVMKFVDESFYKKYYLRKIGSKDFINKIRDGAGGENYLSTDEGTKLKEYLNSGLLEERELYKRLEELERQSSTETDRVRMNDIRVRHLVVQAIANRPSGDKEPVVDKLVRKIEITDRFLSEYVSDEGVEEGKVSKITTH